MWDTLVYKWVSLSLTFTHKTLVNGLTGALHRRCSPNLQAIRVNSELLPAAAICSFTLPTVQAHCCVIRWVFPSLLPFLWLEQGAGWRARYHEGDRHGATLELQGPGSAGKPSTEGSNVTRQNQELWNYLLLLFLCFSYFSIIIKLLLSSTLLSLLCS